MSESDSEIALLLNNISAVLRAVASMPTSPAVRALADRALESERNVNAWSEQPPTSDEREAMMKHVLGLHTALGKLQRPEE